MCMHCLLIIELGFIWVLLLKYLSVGFMEFCLVQAHLGRNKEVSEILEKYVVNRPGIGTAEDETPTWMDTLFL